MMQLHPNLTIAHGKGSACLTLLVTSKNPYEKEEKSDIIMI